MPRSRTFLVLVVAAVVLLVGSSTWWLTRTARAGALGDTCRSLADGYAFAPVPADVAQRSGETSEVTVEQVREPTTAQIEASLEQLEAEAERYDADPAYLDDYVACLVTYSRQGSAGDPDDDPPVRPVVERDHVAALLLYEQRQQRVNPCFGGNLCGDEETYPIDCAQFRDATTGDLLRIEGCWDFRSSD